VLGTFPRGLWNICWRLVGRFTCERGTYRYKQIDRFKECFILHGMGKKMKTASYDFSAILDYFIFSKKA